MNLSVLDSMIDIKLQLKGANSMQRKLKTI